MTSKKNLEYELAMVSAERDFYKVTAQSWQDLYVRAIESQGDIEAERDEWRAKAIDFCGRLVSIQWADALEAMGDE